MKTVAVAFDVQPEWRAQIEGSLAGLARAVFLGDPVFPAALGEAEVLLVRGWRHEIPAETVAGMRRLRLVQCLLAGVDHLPWAEIPSGVVVCHNAGAQSDVVAEHAFALLLAAVRRVVEHDAAMRRGGFPQDERGRRLRGATLGILGYGHIGREVARLGRAFGMRVVAVNRSGRGDASVDEIHDAGDLEPVAAASDFLVCCLPLTKATRGLVGRGVLGAMKPDAVLVNVSRGKVVDEDALYEHLKAHPRFSAALDVWWRYPQAEGERPFTRPFHELSNVVMTPHVAYGVPGNLERVIAHAVRNVQRHLRGEPLENVADPADYR